jgi:hypothetical protein
MGVFVGKECIVEHFSVSIVQRSDGVATVAYIGLDGSVYRFEVSADRAMLFSAQLIGWARYCMAFDPVCEGR